MFCVQPWDKQVPSSVVEMPEISLRVLSVRASTLQAEECSLGCVFTDFKFDCKVT